MVTIRPALATDSAAWTRMRIALWPEHTPEWHADEVAKFFAGQLKMPLAVLIARDDSGEAIGFAELNIRAYAEGAETDRVAFLEGWYVDEHARRSGAGRALIAAGEEWARAQGCTEFGSDALAENEVSAIAHKAVGFTEIEVIRCFMKKLALFILAAALPLGAQTIQYRAPNGTVFRSDVDTGAIARAAAALAADPRSVDKAIALGVAQSGRTQMREAIETFTNALYLSPNNALLYRWRGHRHLSVREFDLAERDFANGLAIDSTVYGIWYHLGIIRFARGDFNGAADAFKRALPRAPDPGELAGSTDWLWMSLSRAGRGAEAKAMLARRPDSLRTAPDYAYTKRLRLYRGEITPEQLFTPSDTAGVQVATLSYGLGNWYMVQGDTAKAKAQFERAIRGTGWAGFGFIVSEAELRRLRAEK
jgi:tetratricopeptide (TPR) repeat protein/RimJ/RimL family protein N-acetyltransferase